ncbi:MAG: hypothetical protein KDB96_13340 [Flavobacteriales bacterium]|nr:hypothetical protein [Flavobacteriales bacterium]
MSRLSSFASAFLLLTALPAIGQWSALDPTFGQNGYVHLNTSGQSHGSSGVVLPDDRVVVAGSLIINNDFWAAVARFLPDGSPDPTFGAGGVDSVDVGGTMGYVVDMARQPDGRLLLLSSSSTFYLVLRILPDGGIDQSFGSNGVSVFPGGMGYVPVAVALQADGKVLVTGRYNSNSTSGSRTLLYRLNADGSLDTGFGINGSVQQDIGTLGREYPADVLVLPDGDLLMAGNVAYGTFGATQFPYFFARYTPDGTLDNTFGTGGLLLDSLGTDLYLIMTELIGQTNGGWVAAGGVAEGDSTRCAVARFLPNGMLDPAFASDGVRTLVQPGRQFQGVSIAQRSDGSILFGGWAENVMGVDYVEFVGHLEANGTIDTAYGGPTGMQVLDPAAFDNHLRYGITGVLAQSTDKLVGISDIEYGGTTGRQLTVFRVEQLATGVQERETLAGLEVWPVPVHDVLFVRCPSALGPDARLQVLDVQGRLVHGERIGPMPTGGTVQLNIDDLAPGTYLLRVEDARQAVLLQWVKE